MRQVSHVRDEKVREMRTADTILNIIQDRGKIGQSQRDKETREPDDAISITSGSEEGREKRPAMDLARSLPNSETDLAFGYATTLTLSPRERGFGEH